jgi:hypothetical protein
MRPCLTFILALQSWFLRLLIPFLHSILKKDTPFVDSLFKFLKSTNEFVRIFIDKAIFLE